MDMYIKNVNIIEEKADGYTVIYDPDTEKTHILNETAAYIWDIMEGTFVLDDIISLLISCLEDTESLDLEVVHMECRESLACMENNGLILKLKNKE